MSLLRPRMSAALAWAMIPLAAWTGMPSTACVCSNGQLKLFCGHRAAHDESDDVHGQGDGCIANCCGHHGLADVDHSSDCCGGGLCAHGGPSDDPSAGSKACCNPVLTAPSLAPQTTSIPCDQVSTAVVAIEQLGALVGPSFIPVAVEFNTGPPLDRVIVFRALLI